MTKQPIAVFSTIITRDYYRFAKVWSDSVRLFYPNAEIVICVADTIPEKMRDSFVDVQLIQADEFQISGFRRMAFQYTPFELTCALKPFLLKHLLSEHETVVYLDADTCLFHQLESIEYALDDYDIILTPHLTKSENSGSENRIRNAGTLNGGFLGIKKSGNSNRFIDWWSERCRYECYIDPLSGRFVDQTWLDLVPSLFEKVLVCRDESLNVAYWNLHDRGFRSPQPPFFVGTQPLGFFHFSGFRLTSPERLTCHLTGHGQTQQIAEEGTTELVRWYAEQLQSASITDLGQLECEFQRYHDGTLIDPFHRETIRGRYAEAADIHDPFGEQGSENIPEITDSLRCDIVLSRKHWQLEQMQQEADRQTAWIQKRLHRRLDKRIVEALKRCLNRFSPKTKAA